MLKLTVFKKYLTTIFMVSIMFLSVFDLYSDKKKKKEEVFKTRDSQFGEVIEVVGSVPLLKTVQSVTVTNRIDIDQIAADSMKELMGLTPGLFTLSTGQFGQVSSTFIRGSKSTQVLYIIDGVKIRDHVSIGGLNLSVIAPSIMDKVEIVRGPLSSIYGSDAQGGVVNIKTINEKKLLFSGSYGSHNSYSGNVSLFKSLGNILLSLSVNSRKNSNNINNDVFKNSGVSAKVAYKKNNLSLGLRYFGNFTDSGVPFTWDFKPASGTNYKQNYSIIALPVTLKLSDRTILKLTGSIVKSDYNFNDPDAFFNFNSKLNSHSYNLETNIKTKIGRYFTLKTGIEYSGFSAVNETDSILLIDDHKSNNFAASVYGDIDLNNFLFFASLRFDKYKDIDSNISPQIGFSYLLDKKFKIRASYSNSFKAPLITHQVNPWGMENFSLKPEKADSYEIGLNYYSGAISLGITYFNSSYTDMIDWVTVDMTTWAGQYQNISSVDIKGYELSTILTPFSDLSIRCAYTYLDTEDLTTGAPLLRRPKHTFSGLVTYKNKLFTTSLQLIFVGSRSDSDPLSWPPLTNSPSFNSFNFNIIVPVHEDLSIFGKLTNALNTEYEEIFGYQSPKRRFEIGFRFKVN